MLKRCAIIIVVIVSDNPLMASPIARSVIESRLLSLEDIIEVCRVSHSNEFIEKMPARYNSEIEENGSNLSGGQKQRLAIARALLNIILHQFPFILILIIPHSIIFCLFF